MNTSQKIYLDAQNASGLKVGDWVEITKEVPEDWNPDAVFTPDIVGKVFKIARMDECGVWLDIKEEATAFPYFVLEKTKEPMSAWPFKTFDKVLVRDEDDDDWRPDHFREYESSNPNYPYYTMRQSNGWAQCIPFEGHEDLVFTSKAPKEITA